jgi:hypothetical protein
MRMHPYLGILLLLAGRLLPFPLNAVAFVLAGAVLVGFLWAASRGWQRWWPLCCMLLATVAFAMFDFLGEEQRVARGIMGGLWVAFLITGLAPALVGVARQFWRAAAAGIDGLKTIRELRKQAHRT